MSDPTSPVPPAAPASITEAARALAQTLNEGSPASSVQPPAPAVAAPQAPAATPAKPPYVNPWQGRAPAPAVAAPSTSPQPAAPAAPVADPRVDALMAVLGETVAQDMSALPANVAATVRAIAGDDPVAQRKAINAMRANGIATPPAAAPAPLPPPANTMPAAAPPAAPVEPTGDAAVLAEYQRLKSRGAFIAASAFYASNAGAIERALKSSPSN